jgi:hypothetical protein
VGRHLEKAMATMRESLEPLVSESVCEERPTHLAAVRATAMAGAVMGMSESSRAALVSTVGSVPRVHPEFSCALPQWQVQLCATRSVCSAIQVLTRRFYAGRGYSES